MSVRGAGEVMQGNLFDWTKAPTAPQRPTSMSGEDVDNYDVSNIPNDVVSLFERLAINVIESGRKGYSADAILHRIRWHYQIERGDESFKCNNNWTAHLGRWFMAIHPEHVGFFEIRRRTEA